MAEGSMPPIQTVFECWQPREHQLVGPVQSQECLWPEISEVKIKKKLGRDSSELDSFIQ